VKIKHAGFTDAGLGRSTSASAGGPHNIGQCTTEQPGNLWGQGKVGARDEPGWRLVISSLQLEEDVIE
jgi:hypothetical protein